MCSGGRRCESGPDPIRLRRKPETIAETDERIYYNQRNRRIWRRIWRQRHWIQRLQPWQLRRVWKKSEKRRTVQPEMKLKAKRSFVFFGFIKQRGKCWFLLWKLRREWWSGRLKRSRWGDSLNWSWQIRFVGLIFLVNYHAPQFEINCLCDNCSFGVGVKWSYCVGFCWGFEVFWVEN